MIVIVDSGSTKADWVFLQAGKIVMRLKTRGYNPNFMTREEFVADCTSYFPDNLDFTKVKKVFFYGAGVSLLQKESVRAVLCELFPNTVYLEVESDIIASAKALLGSKKGLVAILGTGANSCLYDGEKVETKVEAVGYVLGDEGSACYMGKRLIKDYLRNNMPQDCRNKLQEYISLSRDELIDRIYRQSAANTYLASFSTYIYKNLDNSAYYQQLVEDNFKDFFEEVVSKYPQYRDYSLNCVGSVAYFYKDILERVAERYGMKLAKVLQSPMEELIAYFIKQEKYESLD